LILISGYLTDALHREAREAEISHVLRKPIDLASIEATILAAFMNESGRGLPN
jgi:hypothetical protein